MYFCPAHALNLHLTHFNIEATSIFIQLVTSSTPEAANRIISAYQLSDELSKLIPSLLNGVPDPVAILNYIQQAEKIDTANVKLESSLLAMILMRLYDLTEDRETRSLMIELAFTLPDDL